MVIARKSPVGWLVLGIIFSAVLLSLLFWSNLDKQWKDATTWSTESRVILPKETSVLKVKNQVGELQANGEQNFTFEAEYCYLYEIEATEEYAKLRCSLLPMYYAEREKEVTKDWKEKSDIFLVIKPKDVTPADFLGRIDTSFQSVSALGSFKYPVSISIEGSNKYPEKTLANKIKHLFAVLKNGMQPLDVRITAYSVSRLDDISPEKKKAFVKAKAPETWKDIERQVNVNYKSFEDYQKLLNFYNTTFQNYRVICSDLSSCKASYRANSADQFIYYWYSLRSRDLPKYYSLLSTIKHNYPFVEQAPNKEPECQTCLPDWKVMSYGMFPICPINDVLAGKPSTDFEVLSAYVASGAVDAPKTDAEALHYLDQFTMESFTRIGMWNVEQLHIFDGACYYLLKNGTNGREKMASQLIDNYYSMISMMLGTTLKQERTSYEEVMYQSNAFSPYRTGLVLDYAVMRRRETTTMDPAIKASAKYTDIRSLWNTLILLYLYEN